MGRVTQQYTVQMCRGLGIYKGDTPNKIICMGRNPPHSGCLGNTQGYYSKPEQRLNIKQ